MAGENQSCSSAALAEGDESSPGGSVDEQAVDAMSLSGQCVCVCVCVFLG